MPAFTVTTYKFLHFSSCLFAYSASLLCELACFLHILCKNLLRGFRGTGKPLKIPHKVLIMLITLQSKNFLRQMSILYPPVMCRGSCAGVMCRGHVPGSCAGGQVPGVLNYLVELLPEGTE
jgi:hypothetical protein